jgi:hypothetical protein
MDKTFFRRDKRVYITNDSLPQTKTVWGLTKEEIEFYAIFFKVVAIISLIISALIIPIYLILLIILKKGREDLVPVLIYFISCITWSLGIHGITFERKAFLLAFAIMDFLCIIFFSMSAIIFTKFTEGFIFSFKTIH